MYAIIEISGKQFRVQKGWTITVDRQQKLKEGEKIEIKEVLLVDDDGKIALGKPMVKDAIVRATVIDHVKGDTVVVFKKKRRKGYQKNNGHRQPYTRLKVDEISLGETKKAAAAKKGETKAKPKKSETTKKTETINQTD